MRDSALAWLRSYPSDRQQFARHSSPTTTSHAGVPLGSVLGPLMFAAYVSPVGDLAETFGISYHQFADDTQIYVDLSDIGAASTMSQLAACTAAVCHWFLLNTSKSEAMTLGTAVQFQSVESAVRTVDTVGTSFPLINELKTLGIILESHVRSAKHATAGTKT